MSTTAAARPLHGGQAVSADGTAVRYLAVGDGPAVVCLHGGLTTGAEWITVARALAGRYRSVLIDRRGLGATGPGRGPHSVAAEVADVVAVAHHLRGVAAIVGHSFGALIAMQAMLSEPLADALVLYEPPLLRDRDAWRTYAQETAALLAAGRYEAVLLHALVTQLRVSSRYVEQLRADPVRWAQTVSQAPAVTAQTSMMFELAGDYTAMSAIRARTLLLLGERSTDPRFRDAITSLAQVIPDAQTVVLPGQGHSAIRDGPDVLAAAIGRFLANGRASSRSTDR